MIMVSKLLVLLHFHSDIPLSERKGESVNLDDHLYDSRERFLDVDSGTFSFNFLCVLNNSTRTISICYEIQS